MPKYVSFRKTVKEKSGFCSVQCIVPAHIPCVRGEAKHWDIMMSVAWSCSQRA